MVCAAELTGLLESQLSPTQRAKYNLQNESTTAQKLMQILESSKDMHYVTYTGKPKLDLSSFSLSQTYNVVLISMRIFKNPQWSFIRNEGPLWSFILRTLKLSQYSAYNGRSRLIIPL